MRALRRYGLERTQWTLAAFLGERCASELLPAPWVERITAGPTPSGRASRAARKARSTGRSWFRACWTSFTLPPRAPLTSAEFQALRRWQQAVESCGSLGFDGRRIELEGFSLAT